MRSISTAFAGLFLVLASCQNTSLKVRDMQGLETSRAKIDHIYNDSIRAKISLKNISSREVCLFLEGSPAIFYQGVPLPVDISDTENEAVVYGSYSERPVTRIKAGSSFILSRSIDFGRLLLPEGTQEPISKESYFRAPYKVSMLVPVVDCFALGADQTSIGHASTEDAPWPREFSGEQVEIVFALDES